MITARDYIDQWIPTNTVPDFIDVVRAIKSLPDEEGEILLTVFDACDGDLGMTIYFGHKLRIPLKVGDKVEIREPVEGEDHEGGYHKLPRGQIGVIEFIENGAYTVCIPVDAEHNIVNVWDEGDGDIHTFLTFQTPNTPFPHEYR